MMSDILPSMKKVTGELVKGNNILISIVIDDKQTMENYFSNLSVGVMLSCRYQKCLGLPASECWLINLVLFGSLIVTLISSLIV